MCSLPCIARSVRGCLSLAVGCWRFGFISQQWVLRASHIPCYCIKSSVVGCRCRYMISFVPFARVTCLLLISPEVRLHTVRFCAWIAPCFVCSFRKAAFLCLCKDIWFSHKPNSVDMVMNISSRSLAPLESYNCGRNFVIFQMGQAFSSYFRVETGSESCLSTWLEIHNTKINPVINLFIISLRGQLAGEQCSSPTKEKRVQPVRISASWEEMPPFQGYCETPFWVSCRVIT